jgi:hypothetical protein
MAEARKKINDEAGSRRQFAHCIFTPGQPGWLDKLQAALELKPESCKGYTIGDNTHKNLSRYPWRMDDDKVACKGYELMKKAGIKNICITRDCSRRQSRSNSRTCAGSPTWPTSARPPRTGRI